MKTKKIIFSPYHRFEIISVGATKELQLQRNLAKIKGEWMDIKFTTTSYK